MDVVAGIFCQANGNFLLCQRPQNKICAGFWEFPGGKVEKNESLFHALKREISEELHIQITHATPWIVRQFVYPHAHVRLHFFKIHQWQGAIHLQKIEHSAFCWQNLFETLQVAPLLPANLNLLPLLKIPPLALITRAQEEGTEHALLRLEKIIAHNPHVLVQVRDKTFAKRTDFAKQVALLCRHPKTFLVVNDDENLAQHIGAQGVHYSSLRLKKLTQRPNFMLVGASVHSLEELKLAEKLNLDYVFLSPIFKTQSHPNAIALGKKNFQHIATQSAIPVFALGGVKMQDFNSLQQIGAHGIALFRSY